MEENKKSGWGEEFRHFGLLPDIAASQYGDDTLFLFRGKEQSFNELSERSDRVASGLIEQNIEPGERVCIYCPHTPQFPEAFFGIIKGGGVPVPLNLRMPVRTLRYVVENADANTIIGSDYETKYAGPNEAKELAKETEIGRLIIPGEEGDGIIEYSSFLEGADPDFDLPPTDFDDVALQLYTSGTTGRPKGVLHTHRTLTSAMGIYEQGMNELRIGEILTDVRFLNLWPFYHIGGLMLMCAYVHGGSSMVLQIKPDPEKMLRNIEKYKCNVFAGVPTLFNMMLSEYEKDPEAYDLSSLAGVGAAAAPLSESTRSSIESKWDLPFGQAWAMTETAATGLMYLAGSRGASCVGRPFPKMEIKMVDPETRETIVPWEQIEDPEKLRDESIEAEGEIAVRGPAVFEGYYKMPEETEKNFDDEGWFYTGDIMKIDGDGFLYMVERADDMIISGGENIYPAEVEDGLKEHPEVVEAAVVPAPHKVKGEAPVAFVVLKEGADLGEEELREFSLKKVPTYAHPRRIFFMDELPKSGVLKTQRFKLEEEAKSRLSEPLGSS